MINLKKTKELLDNKVNQYNSPSFIENDPICIPHSFSMKQDIEIMGFFASILAWGRRSTIIAKCYELANRMDNAPYEFITQSKEEDLKQLLGFKHRTFNNTDLLYFIHFLKKHFSTYRSLEDAFIPQNQYNFTIENSLNHYYSYFFDDPEHPRRTRKHISAPMNKSACKRLNMFLRWMVRKDTNGVDFGIWERISQKELICPIDVHVERTSRMLGLITRKNTDWLTAVELTNNLRLLDAEDPVKYDFALFGLSIEKEF